MPKIERTINLEATVHCCRVDDGSIGYTSEPSRMNYGETADEFSESLTVWRDRMLDFIEADLEETVDKELCQKVGGKSLRYCGQYTKMKNIRVDETEIAEAVPEEEVKEEVKVTEEEKVEAEKKVVEKEIVKAEKKEIVPEVKISEIEKQAALGRIRRIEERLAVLQATGRAEIERIKKKYGLE